jgi:hypothetical protein
MGKVGEKTKVAVKAAPKSKLDTPPTTSFSFGSGFIEDSITTAMDEFSMTIHGPPGHGKTFCALSASKYWPEVFTKPVALHDILHVGFDRNALAGAAELGIRVPAVDTRKVLREGGARDMLDLLSKLGNEIIPDAINHGVETVIVDTVSRMDRQLVEYWTINCPTSKSGTPDTRAKWTMLAHTHSRFLSQLRTMPVNLIFCCHSKALIESDTKEGQDQALRNRATATPGPDDIVPEITGQSLNLYTGDVSMEFVLMASPKALGKGFDRWLYPYGAKGFRAKNRWQQTLAEKEEPNLNKLFAKIRNRINEVAKSDPV